MTADEGVSRSAGQTHISQLGTQRHSELQQPRTPALQLGMDINTVMIVGCNAISILNPYFLCMIHFVDLVYTTGVSAEL